MEKPKLIKDLGIMLPKPTSKRKRHYGLYQCPLCKKQFKTRIEDVESGNTKSCGCFKQSANSKVTHPLYKIWNGMKQRIQNSNSKSYKDYGAKGITICERWLDFSNFIEDMYPTYKKGLSIDRINNNGNYEPDNCRWTTQTIQSRNTRKIMSTNTSGYRGVYWNKKREVWCAQIKVDSKMIYLGSFTEIKEAAKKYDTYVISNNLEHTINNV